jgi:nitroreductase
MASILDHIMQRRSIRRYTDEPVTGEEITLLLQAAMAAPSAMNRKPWEFVVLTEPERLQALRRRLVLGKFNAPVAIVVCGNLKRAAPAMAKDFWVLDCSAATQNILLAATGLGLGTVWIGVYPVRLIMSLVSRLLELPKHVSPLAVIWVGHPAQDKSPRTQYDEDNVHWESYGGANQA